MLIETLMILALQAPDHPKALTPAVAREYVMERASRAGYNSRERACLDELVHRESRWRNVKTRNRPRSATSKYCAYRKTPRYRNSGNGSTATFSTATAAYVRHSCTTTGGGGTSGFVD